MKAIIGLGNLGKEYESTRHNIGFLCIDFIAKELGVTFNRKFQSEYGEINYNGEKLILLKPQTFMNASGSAVVELMKFYKLTSQDIYIAFDDLDLQQSQFKIQKSKYPKVHNGINDIINKTGSDAYTYIRIGIDDRTPELRKVLSGRDYVLQRVSYDFSEVFQQIQKEIL